MKKTVIIILIAVVLFTMFACKSKEAEKMPDKDLKVTPFIYAPLPPFSEIFKILDYLKLNDYDTAIPEKIFTAKQETGSMAFALGVLTADGIVSVRSHNKTKVTAIAEEMIKISNFLSLDESILRLADQLKELIAQDQWEELEKALENYKNEVEGTLYQQQQYDQFTMMQLGGWVEGVNRIAWFVQRKYSADKTKVLDQKGTLNSLIKNMSYIETPSIKEQTYFTVSNDKLQQIRGIIDAPKDGTYSKEQVEQLLKLSQEAKDGFQK
jgi:hypothetical protein